MNLYKHILIGISGGVACYKTLELIRRLRELNAEVDVIMTASAQKFISPLLVQAISGTSVRTTLWDEQAEAAMGHIELARKADLTLIAPASANTLAKLCHGYADDLLTTVCLASKAPLLVAPSMNQQMWQHAAVQANLEILRQRGVIICGPNHGSQACGDVGLGRMLEPDQLLLEIQSALNPKPLIGKRVVITAGPTREAIDAVRYISNYSSGKMGYALARAAYLAGAEVILISGPSELAKPDFVKLVRVQSAHEMQQAVIDYLPGCDIFIGAAAVSDYHVAQPSNHKIKKSEYGLNLALQPSVDIIKMIGAMDDKPFLVGFAAESENLLANAKQKLQRKNLDLIIANLINEPDSGFHYDTNKVTVLSETEQFDFDVMSKLDLAEQLIALVSCEFLHKC